MKTLNKFLEQAEPAQEPKKEDPKLKQDQKKENMLKKRVLMAKMRAVRQGATGIMASYEPNIEGIVEYFYEEGINEEGFDQLIEEIGLEEFVNFVDESSLALNEERAARRATVRAKKYDVVKKEVDKADAARKKAKKGEYAPSYAKKETDVTVYDDKPAAKKKAPKKPVAPKKPIAPKKPVRTKKPVTKKVVKAVAKVKKTQPAKKPSKQGLGDRISAAYKAGVKRHRKATQGARVFAKGFKSGAKKAVKFAKDVKKVVSEEEMNEGIMQMIKRVKKKPEKKAEKAMDAGARAKRKLARKVHAKYVSGSEDNVPDDIREEKKKGLDGKACWKGYKLAGTKKKGGKTVDNCVKVDEAKEDAGKSPEQKEKDRNVRKFGVSHNVAGHGKLRRALHRSDRGDKKRRGDKSAYVEMESKKNPNNLVEPRDGVDSAKEVNRATRKAAFRPFNKEEKDAFAYVVAKLKKQHGDGVLTKRDKIKPQSAAEKAKVRAHQAKIDKENAAERAKDPSQGRYPKG